MFRPLPQLLPHFFSKTSAATHPKIQTNTKNLKYLKLLNFNSKKQEKNGRQRSDFLSASRTLAWLPTVLDIYFLFCGLKMVDWPTAIGAVPGSNQSAQYSFHLSYTSLPSNFQIIMQYFRHTRFRVAHIFKCLCRIINALLTS